MTILSPVVNNAPHPATVRDGPWTRSKTMKQRSPGPETKFRDGRVAKYRANSKGCRSTRTSLKRAWSIAAKGMGVLWIVGEMESDFNEEEGGTVSRVFNVFVCR